MSMLRWYRTEMHLLKNYSLGWALKFGVPGRRWLIIPLGMWGFCMATAWLVASPIVRHHKPPALKPWFIGRCQLYMRGGSMEALKSGLPVGYW
jgi:hypothetical protein